jgi:zinc finger SWIM domain-containing protein 3
MMQKIFAKFPELLMVDATYKLKDLAMTLYLLMVVDGNGENEIVGTFLAADESRETVKQMIQMFKAHNSAHDKVQAIFTDRDLVERQVLHEELSQAPLLVRPLHVLQTFRRDVTCERMSITPPQRDTCLEILQHIVHSQSREEYNEKCKLLEQAGIQTVVDYYKNVWEEIRQEFVECFSGMNLPFGSRPDSKPDSINEKVKRVCSRRNSTLVDFYSELLIVLHDLRTERDDRMIHSLLQKKSVLRFTPYPSNSPETPFLAALTPYAYCLLKPHVDTYRSVVIDREIDETSCELSGIGCIDKAITSLDACPCLFRTSTGLPCKHIMAVRSMKSLNVFDRQLVADRWTREYYVGYKKELQTELNAAYGGVDERVVDRVRLEGAVIPPQVTSAQRRYREATVKVNELAFVVAEATSASLYTSRLEQMKQLCEAWRDGRETAVRKTSDPPADSCSTRRTELTKENILGTAVNGDGDTQNIGAEEISLSDIVREVDGLHDNAVTAESETAVYAVEMNESTALNAEYAYDLDVVRAVTSDLYDRPTAGEVFVQDDTITSDGTLQVVSQATEFNLRNIRLPPQMYREMPKSADKALIGLAVKRQKVN